MKPQKRDENPKPPPTTPVSPSPVVPEVPRVPQVQLLRGMRDILPSEQVYWDHLRQCAAVLARTYGFQRIDTPILEDTALFTRAVGKTTDIVEKEMFSFVDQGDERVSLRPEGTAPVVRAYIEHGMLNQPQPVKLWYFAPMFRHERPQAGRYRQHHQIGFEVIGERHPAVDAELILLGANIYRSLGISIHVEVNSIGCPLCRPGYEQELTTYLRSHRTDLCETCRRRMTRGAVLRVLDCKESGCREVREGAPQIVDWLCEVCKQHFIRVLEYLDELEIPYALAPFLVRGLDYYTKTAFEFLAVEAGSEPGSTTGGLASALGGGGRYDGLVEVLGGRPTPAAGFGIGAERAILKMKEAITAGHLAAPSPPAVQVYIAQLGEQAKRKAMKLFEQFRMAGVPLAAQFAKDGLKSQLEHANRMGVRLTLILGQKEVIDGTIIIREMSSGIQEIVAFEKVLGEVEKRLTQESVRATVTEVVPDIAGTSDDRQSGVPAVLKGLPPPPTIEDFEASGDAETPDGDDGEGGARAAEGESPAS